MKFINLYLVNIYLLIAPILPNFIKVQLKRFAPKPLDTVKKLIGDEGRLPYRGILFKELITVTGSDVFIGGRILEIGPKDGLDTKRLASLRPSYLCSIDLPEKTERNKPWIKDTPQPYEYIEANILYMPADSVTALGQFNLVWCTGVLYHNAEQLRLLKRLYKLLLPGGILVLESATTRNPRCKDLNCVEVMWPETYRGTGTITHLPSKMAIKSWLEMSGFEQIRECDCYRTFNKELRGQRAAFLAYRLSEENRGFSYYAKSNKNPSYLVGDSI